MRLIHLTNCCDVKRGVWIVGTRNVRGKAVYRLNKHGAPMTFVFCLGRHVADIRDAAHLYAEEFLPHLQRLTGPISPLVINAVLEKAAPFLIFEPAKREIHD